MRFTREFKPKDTQRFREKFKAQKYDEITFFFRVLLYLKMIIAATIMN